MTIPVSSHHSPQAATLPPEGANTSVAARRPSDTAPPRGTAAEAQNQAADQVEVARSQRAAPRQRSSFDRAIGTLAREYLDHTTSGMREVLANCPEMVAALANATPEEIHAALVTEFERVDDTFHDSMRADNVMSVVNDTVSNLMRQGVMREARVTSRARMR